MRIWFKKWSDNHLIGDITIVRDEEDTRTHKVFGALEEACIYFDISKPIWLQKNVNEFKKRAKTRFGQDNFIETLDFDYLEIHVLDED